MRRHAFACRACGRRPHSRGAFPHARMPASIASSSLLTELLVGKTVAEIREITAEQISDSLGGLPPATHHASQLAEDAVDVLVDRL